MEQKSADNIVLWVEDYTRELFSWAFHKVSDAELAQDLVQDTFLAAAEKIENFKGESSPKTWLFSILNHKIIDYYRKKINQTVSYEEQSITMFFDDGGSWLESKRPEQWKEDNEKHILDDREFQMVLERCLDALPDKWNIAVKLKYLTGKNAQEICQELGVTTSNFWQIIHRAKLQLRDCVNKNWEND